MREWRLKIDNSVLFANGTAPPSGSISLEVLEPNWWAVFVCSYIFFCWHLQTKWTKWSNFRHSLYFLSIKVLFSAIPNRPSTRALESFQSLFPSSSFKFFLFFFSFPFCNVLNWSAAERLCAIETIRSVHQIHVLKITEIWNLSEHPTCQTNDKPRPHSDIYNEEYGKENEWYNFAYISTVLK